MKKSSIYIFITAVTAFACLCGILFVTSAPISDSDTVVSTEREDRPVVFSLEKAKQMIDLCAVSYEPEKLESALSAMGYQEFEYTQKQDSDGTAVGIALKEEENFTKIIAVFRGTYKEEWHSNFNIEEGVEHKGFASASDYVLKKIEDYILLHQKDSTKVTLELTGHSRGGAVANITAKNLTQKGLIKEVSAYTFASPNTTTASDAFHYKNIFNIVNTEDFICYIPLGKWGYTKYGITIPLPDSNSTQYEEFYNSVSEIYTELTGKTFYSYKKGNTDVENFISSCEEICPTLQDYYNKKITVGSYTITMSEYMRSAATLLSGENNLSDAMLLISGSTSETLSPVTEFIMAGVDPESTDQNTDFTDTPIGCGHSCETYKAWLEVLNENYFLQSTKE